MYLLVFINSCNQLSSQLHWFVQIKTLTQQIPPLPQAIIHVFKRIKQPISAQPVQTGVISGFIPPFNTVMFVRRTKVVCLFIRVVAGKAHHCKPISFYDIFLLPPQFLSYQHNTYLAYIDQRTVMSRVLCMPISGPTIQSLEQIP